ncbi:P1 family peptidase [Halovulum sp. GXIMD14793]
MKAGPRNLITDIAGLRVGNAEDAAIKTGVTVLTADAPFAAAVHVMGGAPGTRDTELLAPDKTVAGVDALVLSGGSAFGLDAASGVSEGLRAAGRGFAVGDVRVPIVPAAILFDLMNGGDKGWAENPYCGLGAQAFVSAGPGFLIGSHGAGTGAITARLKGGLGSASVILDNGITVGALVAVNPVGHVCPPGSRQFWAGAFEIGEEFGGLGAPATPHRPVGLSDTKLSAALSPGTATTIAIVATDAHLTKAELTRVATAAHDGLARAIVPAHTPLDGDLVFAVSTGRPDATPGPADLAMLGHEAATVLARAIARGVFAATPAAGDQLPCWSGSSA